MSSIDKWELKNKEYLYISYEHEKQIRETQAIVSLNRFPEHLEVMDGSGYIIHLKRGLYPYAEELLMDLFHNVIPSYELLSFVIRYSDSFKYTKTKIVNAVLRIEHYIRFSQHEFFYSFDYDFLNSVRNSFDNIFENLNFYNDSEKVIGVYIKTKNGRETFSDFFNDFKNEFFKEFKIHKSIRWSLESEVMFSNLFKKLFKYSYYEEFKRPNYKISQRILEDTEEYCHGFLIIKRGKKDE